ncbi:MAG: 2,3-diphosphoglycerate-dependent phosphoglycerate mutase [Alphaproteobacteria bacterium]|nr:2,3-diphosphoglycerate-dependent phosphoglycerate mutase [Alphaproteobacteria bacterium]
MNYLVLLRHGQSQWNLENKFTGFHDVDLTAEGEAEARKAGRLLKEAGISFDKVFSSTLTRANRTAEIALSEAGQGALFADMVRHDDLRERDYGDLTGLNKDETREKYGEEQVHIWRRSYDVQPPGGECLQDVVENRVRPYYKKNIEPHVESGENILIAAHGNSLRAMLIILGAETPETINEAEMPTGVPLVFEMENGKIVKRYFLDQPSIEEDEDDEFEEEDSATHGPCGCC